MISLKVLRSESGDRFLPAFYGDNYVSSLTDEPETIETKVGNADTRGEKPKVTISGYNLKT